MKTKLLFFVALASVLFSAKSQSYDTIYMRPPNAYMQDWYDNCDYFYDSTGQMCLTNACTAIFGYWDMHHMLTCQKGEAGHLINGLGCMVSIDWVTKCGQTHYYTRDTVEDDKGRYLYLYNWSGVDQFRTFDELIRVRWDTVTPRVLKLPRNADTAAFGFEYCYYYEVMFDTMIAIDSNFAVGGDYPQDIFPWADNTVEGYRPVFYVGMTPPSRQCVPYSDLGWMYYTGTMIGSLSGNPSDVNNSSEHAIGRSPWGPFFALSNNAELRAEADTSLPGAGHVRGAGHYVLGTDHAIQAYPSTGYRFSHWHDGDTANPRIVNLTQDTLFVAHFAPLERYAVSVFCRPARGGSVLGTGLRYEGEVGLTAQPNPGYAFARWDDGSADPSRTILLDRDTLLAAHFRQLDSFKVNVEMVPPQGGVLTYGRTGMYCEGDWADFTVAPNTYWTFKCWDDSSNFPSRSIQVVSDTVLRAYFHSPEGIGQADLRPASFTLSPNPARDQVVLTCQAAGQAEAVVSNALGREVSRTPVMQGRAVISTADLPAGVYFVTLTTHEGSSTQRLVVE